MCATEQHTLAIDCLHIVYAIFVLVVLFDNHFGVRLDIRVPEKIVQILLAFFQVSRDIKALKLLFDFLDCHCLDVGDLYQ